VSGDDSWASAADIPALAAVLRAGLLRKVRVFEVWCKSGEHRCVQVLTIDGRPLALGVQVTEHSYIVIGGTSRSMTKHRAWTRGVWLDVAQARIPVAASCRCGDNLVIAGWLREQIAAGRRRRVLDAGTREEIRQLGVTYPPLNFDTL
jgi:hypothetical protein